MCLWRQRECERRLIRNGILHNRGFRVSPADPYHLVKQLRRRGWEAGVAHRGGGGGEGIWGGGMAHDALGF